MHKLKASVRKLAYRFQHNFLSLGSIVEVIALIICLWFAFGTINAMSRNWQLKQKLQERKIEQARLEIEVEKLKLEQQYYQTEEYRELLARSKGGRMAEGETMVVLPRNSEEARMKHYEGSATAVQEKSNFEKWLDLLFR
jgi:cell division protein FtsL